MNPTTARPNPPRSAKSEPRRHYHFPCHEMRFRGVEDQFDVSRVPQDLRHGKLS